MKTITTNQKCSDEILEQIRWYLYHMGFTVGAPFWIESLEQDDKGWMADIWVLPNPGGVQVKRRIGCTE